MKRSFFRLSLLLFIGLAFAACAGTRQALIPGASPPLAAGTDIGVSADDVAMAAQARILSYRIMHLRTNGPSHPLARTKIKYPADLVYKKGPVMKEAASFNIYVNCPSHTESCWGDPEGFEKNLTGSTFAKLLTQYTKSSPRGYTLGGSFSVKYRSYTKLLYQNDLLTVLHAALVKNGKQAGYATMYHIFLPKGTDTCFDRTRVCYSPDHPATNSFCAYHESVAFKDVPQPVIASVEPYQKVGFCASRASSGASALTNSTVSTLAHEMFESITDPGPAYGWFNFTFGSEIGDLCQTFQWKISVDGVVYSIQPMYSNHYHACANGP
ncbi:MAG: hypothetical protein JO030_01740 [Candidatus Eremiobacteraeota bacterium]|nr:hypothetical protein [Candidatus Eremiobacteraeota bacterium]